MTPEEGERDVMQAVSRLSREDRLLLKHQIIEWLTTEKAFTATGAAKCAENFIATMEFTGLPVKPKQTKVRT